jgi:hypothetical protein
MGIGDSTIAAAGPLRDLRLARFAGAAGAGAMVGVPLAGTLAEGDLLLLLCALAFAGGLLSTWSPCGYSSLSLLRPAGPYRPRSVAAWVPTLGAHALGYLAGGLVLGSGLGLLAWLLPAGGPAGWPLVLLGALALGYSLHQLRLIRMPYPQRRAQVPHEARVRLPMWQTGLLYGWQLGLNFVTYVRTPILYLVVLAALLGGSPGAAVLLVLALNLGRFLPMLVNFLPLPDWTVQRWLASNERAAVNADAMVLGVAGTLLLSLGLS